MSVEREGFSLRLKIHVRPCRLVQVYVIKRLENSVFVFYTMKNMRTTIRVVKIAIHLPVNESFSVSIQ